MGEQALDLFARMLRCNPAERVTAAEALKHAYFEGLSRERLCLYDKK